MKKSLASAFIAATIGLGAAGMGASNADAMPVFTKHAFNSIKFNQASGASVLPIHYRSRRVCRDIFSKGDLTIRQCRDVRVKHRHYYDRYNDDSWYDGDRRDRDYRRYRREHRKDSKQQQIIRGIFGVIKGFQKLEQQRLDRKYGPN